jgi:hypothetical protein
VAGAPPKTGLPYTLVRIFIDATITSFCYFYSTNEIKSHRMTYNYKYTLLLKNIKEKKQIKSYIYCAAIIVLLTVCALMMG